MSKSDSPGQRARRARRALDDAGGLVHRGEIARRLDPRVSIQRAGVITEADDFPAPYDTLGNWPIWVEADVAAWAQTRGRAWLTREQADERDQGGDGQTPPRG